MRVARRIFSQVAARGNVRQIIRMKPSKVRLWVKPYCGWCHEAEDWLEERGIEYERLDVTADRAARQEMQELSGQTLAPVIEVDGELLADFDTEQLEEFWKRFENAPQ